MNSNFGRGEKVRETQPSVAIHYGKTVPKNPFSFCESSFFCKRRECLETGLRVLAKRETTFYCVRIQSRKWSLTCAFMGAHTSHSPLPDHHISWYRTPLEPKLSRRLHEVSDLQARIPGELRAPATAPANTQHQR
jgi:hypothetical protein